MRKWLLVGALAVGLLAPLALFAQSLTPQTFTGGEIIRLTTQSGSTSQMTVSQARGSVGYQLVTPTPSGTYSPTAAINSVLFNGQPASSTIVNTPVSTGDVPLADGQLFQVCNTTSGAFAANTTTLQPASGHVINGGNIALTTLASFTCVELTYVLASNTWYRIR